MQKHGLEITNTNKYRKKGEKNNTHCKECNKPTWTRVGIFTVFNGKPNHWLDFKKPPISHFVLNGGVVCHKCWIKYSEIENEA